MGVSWLGVHWQGPLEMVAYPRKQTDLYASFNLLGLSIGCQIKMVCFGVLKGPLSLLGGTLI